MVVIARKGWFVPRLYGNRDDHSRGQFNWRGILFRSYGHPYSSALSYSLPSNSILCRIFPTFSHFLSRRRYLAAVHRYQQRNHEDTHSFERAPHPITRDPGIIGLLCLSVFTASPEIQFLPAQSVDSIRHFVLFCCKTAPTTLPLSLSFSHSRATVVEPMNGISCSDCCEARSTRRNYEFRFLSDLSLEKFNPIFKLVSLQRLDRCDNNFRD